MTSSKKEIILKESQRLRDVVAPLLDESLAKVCIIFVNAPLLPFGISRCQSALYYC